MLLLRLNIVQFISEIYDENESGSEFESDFQQSVHLHVAICALLHDTICTLITILIVEENEMIIFLRVNCVIFSKSAWCDLLQDV